MKNCVRPRSIKVLLSGGLGNQLFQLTAGLSLCSEENDSVEIDTRTGNPRKGTSGDAEVLDFDISQSVKVANTSNPLIKIIRSKLYARILTRSLKTQQSLFSKTELAVFKTFASFFFSSQSNRFPKVIASNDLGFTDLEVESKNIALIGYFQTYRYLQNREVQTKIAQITSSSINMDVEYWKELAEKEKPLVVHIRRGDYLSEPKFGVLSQEYYLNALKELLSKTTVGKMWVFSDDISAAKRMISSDWGLPLRFFDPLQHNSVQTLEIMRLGKAFIIANSTFSYWAATLSLVDGSLIVCPRPWFRDLNDPTDLIDPRWRREDAVWS